jgi:DNA-directed RNA polymerase subunit RPC12/RpoP
MKNRPSGRRARRPRRCAAPASSRASRRSAKASLPLRRRRSCRDEGPGRGQEWLGVRMRVLGRPVDSEKPRTGPHRRFMSLRPACRVEPEATPMTIYKCPHCRSEYGLIMARLSFRQRSYAKCQVCHKTMYSWNGSNVPRFTLVRRSDAITPAAGAFTRRPPAPRQACGIMPQTPPDFPGIGTRPP